jgi:hypothetical protein
MQQFCDNFGHDEEGDFCIVKALEGYGCHCPYTVESCHVVIDFMGKTKIQCDNGHYQCQDFEPTPWLQQELLGVNDFSI